MDGQTAGFALFLWIVGAPPLLLLLADWLERVVDTPALVELRAPLERLLQLHYRYRFDPLGLDEIEREALRREAKECLEALAQQR